MYPVEICIYSTANMPEADSATVGGAANHTAAAGTEEALRQVRQRIATGRVVWLVPNSGQEVRLAVQRVARANSDRIIDTAPFVAADRLHPGQQGYAAIAGAAALN